MVRYCKRDGCGHEEYDHNGKGRCMLTVPEGRSMAACKCEAFIGEAETIKVEAHQFVMPGAGEDPKPPSKRPSAPPELKLVEDAAADELRRQAEPTLGQKMLAAVGADPDDKSRIFVQLFLAGKRREFTELAAAANAIIRETNCSDLAEGVEQMAARIRELQQELKGRVVIELTQNIHTTSANPESLADAIRKACEATMGLNHISK